ncbi:MAG: hypothetical protein H0T91_08650 [Propionibacteriaceae bacterium]|nr:hypothetical protein [Propionibacteriaceae bacterium]
MTDILRDAFQRTADAHDVHEAEELGGVYDNEWPQWYAEHMTRTLGEKGYRLSRSGPE